MAEVYAGLAYYYDHREEIDRQIQADDAFIAKIKSELGQGSLAF